MDKKVKLKILLSALCIVAALFLIIGMAMYIRLDNPSPQTLPTNSQKRWNGNYIKYEAALEKEDIIKKYDRKILYSYEEYQEFINESKYESKLTESDFNNNAYIIAFAENDYCRGKINDIRDVKVESNVIAIEIGYDGSCGQCASDYTLYTIAINKDKINDNTMVSKYKYVRENDYDCDPQMEYKPIIYLYPREETKITIKLLKPEQLTVTYPKYNDIWDVTAKPNGDLIDNQTGRSLYGLYWEGKNYNSKLEKEGFIVKGSDTISFLENSLSRLGLNEREANEFIIYWLPKLENNKYNYIHFSGTEFMNKEMPLEVNPKPNTMIRILMEYKPLERPINVEKQELKAPERKGFTLIEWGGTELK